MTFAATFVLVACSDGQIGNATASELCAPNDTACATRPIPPVAVGATLALEITAKLPTGGEAPATHLRIVDEGIVVEEEGVLRALAPGVTAVLFMTTDGRVLDFTHVASAAPERLVLVRGQGETVDPRGIDGALVVVPGSATPLTVLARSDSQTLGGDLEPVATVDDESWSVRDDVENGLTLFAPAATERVVANLLVQAVGHELSLSVEVQP